MQPYSAALSIYCKIEAKEMNNGKTMYTITWTSHNSRKVHQCNGRWGWENAREKTLTCDWFREQYDAFQSVSKQVGSNTSRCSGNKPSLVPRELRKSSPQSRALSPPQTLTNVTLDPEGRGGISNVLYWETPPDVQPFTLLYSILAEKVTLLYIFHWQMVPPFTHL